MKCLRSGPVLSWCFFVVSPLLLGVLCLLGAEFRVTSIRVTNNDVRLEWNAPPGSNYVVQFATHVNSNFVNLGPTNAVPSGVDQLLSYTNVGARTSASTRFYRVRAFAPPRLEIYPTNAIIAPGMTNRFKVFLVAADAAPVDITTNGSLSFTSSNTVVAQFVRISTNGFATVRGINQGISFVRAAYQGASNAVPLTVSNMTGGMFTQPSSFSGYVQGNSSTGKVFGVFGSNTNNITPATELGGFSPGTTGVDFRVAADVANSFALITGQSAADDSVAFVAGAFQTPPVPVHWCEFTDVTLDPANIQINVGQTQIVAVIGHRADGTMTNVVNRITSLAFNTSFARTERDASTLRVIGLAAGSTGFTVSANNPVNCGTLLGIGSLTVTPPPTAPVITNQPPDQTIGIGTTTAFSARVSGSSPLAYQWQFNNGDMAGATNNVITVSNANYQHQGNYRFIVTNAYGSTTSLIAMLNVVPSGATLWTNQYLGPGEGYGGATALVVDGSNNVVVTGHSLGSNSYDYATVKYSGAGLPLWTNRYHGPGNGYDSPTAIAVDGAGNIFITGGITVSGGTYDYATIKYSSGGVPLWTNRYNGAGNASDQAAAITVDSSGNVLVTGYASVSGGSSDYATIKYSNAGVALWTNRYNGPGNHYDQAKAIAIDGSNNVFVTGESRDTNSYDYATIKYSSAGVPLWTNRYNGEGNFADDQPAALAIDSSGSVYVTGYSSGTNSSRDYATIKYSGAGAPLWTNRYNGPANYYDVARGLAVDADGNVFVTGVSSASTGDQDYCTTIKYSHSGVPMWTNRYSGPVASGNTTTAIVRDGSNNVVVIVRGYSYNTGSYSEATIKYSGAGTILWVGTSGYADFGFPGAVATDSSGNVYVAGSGGGFSEFRTVKFGSQALPSSFSKP
jgi:hypothetical protein